MKLCASLVACGNVPDYTTSHGLNVYDNAPGWATQAQIERCTALTIEQHESPASLEGVVLQLEPEPRIGTYYDGARLIALGRSGAFADSPLAHELFHALDHAAGLPMGDKGPRWEPGGVVSIAERHCSFSTR